MIKRLPPPHVGAGNGTCVLHKNSSCSSPSSHPPSPLIFYLTENQLLFWAADPSDYKELLALEVADELPELHTDPGLDGISSLRFQSLKNNPAVLSSGASLPSMDGPALS